MSDLFENLIVDFLMTWLNYVSTIVVVFVLYVPLNSYGHMEMGP